MNTVRRLAVEAAITPEGWADYETWSRIQGGHAVACVVAGVVMGISGVYGTLLGLDVLGMVRDVPDTSPAVLLAALLTFAASTAVAGNSAWTLFKAPVYIDGRCEALSPSTQNEPNLSDDNEADLDPEDAIARAVAA